MGWMDDLTARAKQYYDEGIKDINTYLGGRAVDEVVKIAAAQTGNLTAAQLAAGERGDAGAIKPASTASTLLANAQQASQIKETPKPDNTKMYLILVAVGIGALLLMKKSRS